MVCSVVLDQVRKEKRVVRCRGKRMAEASDRFGSR